MDTIKAAIELQRAIQQDPAYIEFASAKLKNDNNQDLQQDIKQFNDLQASVADALANEDNASVRQFNDEIKPLYTKIMASEGMREYSLAKQELDNLKEQVNAIIAEAFGLSKQSCGSSGGCGSSCGGCGS